MKKTSTLLVFLLAIAFQLQAQSKQPKQLGLPGDNLNLYAALKLFQESKTLEDFEKAKDLLLKYGSVKKAVEGRLL